ncbi:MAG: hypothetical protein M5R41_08185 [Bacteroidia bacterium]|nr:hypothetical protein [Bacteroidia bacterium]
MKHSIAIIALLLALAVQAGAQEQRGVQLELTVNNGQGREQVLTIGVLEGASNGLDMHLGEAELPPQPPNEIFDARCYSTPGASQLGTGSHFDFRAPATGNTFVMKYTIAYQAGLNAQGVTLTWDTPYPGRITRLRIDDADMAGKTELVSQFATGQFTVELSFDMSPLGFTATPNPVTFSVNNRDPRPSTNLIIRTQGDTRAAWTIDAENLDWLDIEPMSGEGEGTVLLSVNTQVLPAGNYDGMIRIRSAVYPARLDVPVTMTMTVGVGDVPHPVGLHLGQNYPNPFNPTTMIDIDLGETASDATPRLIVQDMLGRIVADLSSELRSVPGRQTVAFSAADLPGGVYSYTLSRGTAMLTRSMIVVK